MSSPPHTLDTHESDAVPQDSEPQISENPEETPPQSQPDPTKSDPETLPVDNPDHSEKEDEEEEKEVDDAQGQDQETPEENTVISAGMPQPITRSHVSTPDVTLPLSSRNPNLRRGASKRKKGKGKGKGKPNIKKQQMFEKRLQPLLENLNPIPFIPHKILDFSKHEGLFRKLGLWDFVNIDFDRNLRRDLIAQLVASYESRCSYVNGHRIGVNRPDMARAFKIPLKKDKGNVGGVQIDLDCEPFSEDSIEVMVEFVSDWVLLHDDMWMMPDEVMNWIKLVKDGHPEKVDWAGLIWFMVEKELAHGENLRNCYYASHLQHLMKEQRVFTREEAESKVVKINEEARELEDVNETDEKVNDTIKCPSEEDGAIVGPSVELTLGQDGEKEEGVKDGEIMDLDNLNEENDEERVNVQEQWLMHGKNDIGDHFLQRCSSENGRELGENSKWEEEAEFEENGEAGDKFNVFPNDALVGEGLTGNFLQSMEDNQITFSTGQPDMQQMDLGPSFLNDSGKRPIEHDNVMLNHLLTDSNKRLKIDGPIEQKALDFGTCLENTQQMMEQARMFYQEKENALEQSNMHNQILLNEVQKRDNVIELLHKSRFEEMQKKDNEIYRYERELFLMGNVLEGYRKALKDTKKAFDEYRKRAQLLEEPAYKDVGGGLMLSTGEIERIRKQQEDEFQIKCLIVEEKVKEAENDCIEKFDAFLEKINILDKKLTSLEADAKELSGSLGKRKVLQTEEKVLEVAELPANEEKVAQVTELPADEVDNCQ